MRVDGRDSRLAVVASRIVVLILAAWGCAVVVPEFLRVFGDYATLGFSANNDGLITSVDAPTTKTSEALPLQVGDCIDLPKTALPDRLAVFGGLGGLTYVRPDLKVQLYIKAPCDSDVSNERTFEAREPEVTIANRVVLFFDQAFALLFIALAVTMVWQRPSKMTWGFFLYANWFNPGQYFVLYAELQHWPYALLAQEVLQALAQALGYAGFVIFAIRFPHDRVAPKWRAWETWYVPVGAFVLFVLSLLSFAAGVGFRSEYINRWSYTLGYAVAFGVLLILRVRRKEMPPEDMQRARWVHWGCRVGLVAFVFADSNMATDWWTPLWEPLCARQDWLSNHLCTGSTLAETVLLSVFLLNVTLALAVFHAVQRHRVIDVRFAVSRGTTLFLTWLIIAIAITFVSTEIEEYLQHFWSLQFLWYFVAVLCMKMAFETLHERLNQVCDKVFFHRLHVARDRIAKAGAEFVPLDSFDAIDGRIRDLAVHSFDLTGAAVLRRNSANTFERISGSTAPRHALSCEQVAREIGNATRPVRLSVESGLVTELGGSAQAVLAAPIQGASGTAAVVLYGGHRSGTDLADEEVTLLGDLCLEAGRAYVRVAANGLQQRNLALESQIDRIRHLFSASSAEPGRLLRGLPWQRWQLAKRMRAIARIPALRRSTRRGRNRGAG
jgi:hypothetical protein